MEGARRPGPRLRVISTELIVPFPERLKSLSSRTEVALPCHFFLTLKSVPHETNPNFFFFSAGKYQGYFRPFSDHGPGPLTTPPCLLPSQIPQPPLPLQVGESRRG